MTMPITYIEIDLYSEKKTTLFNHAVLCTHGFMWYELEIH